MWRLPKINEDWILIIVRVRQEKKGIMIQDRYKIYDKLRTKEKIQDTKKYYLLLAKIII